MILGTPIWLWLGLAVVIPVLIHLWNKRSGRPRLLGTFRFLPEESFASAKRIELHEIPLMLIRMLIILLLTLLLTGLFLEDEVEGVEHIIISETSGGEFAPNVEGDGIPLVTISPKEVQQKGWWNVLEQIEYREQPKRITVRGDLSESNFKGDRPNSNAVVSWEPLDSLYTNELTLAVWQLGDEQYRALIQRRTETGIETFIEEVTPSEIRNSGEEVIDGPRLILNPENKEGENLGLEYAADTWGIEMEEQPMKELAQLEFGERTIRLIQETEELGGRDLIVANRIFGISISVKEMRAVAQPPKEILTTRNRNIPFLYVDINGNMVVNGAIEQELQSWVYAGIAQRLFIEAFGVDHILTPELIGPQRDLTTLASSERGSIPTAQRSAQLWLMGLLACCWLFERWLAPKRGM